MRITVLCGGLSGERDVSLVTGAMAANALRRKGHEVADIDMFFGTQETNLKALFTKEESKSEYKIAETSPDIAAIRASRQGGTGHIGQGVIELCLMSDIVFFALHGTDGEDGKIQSLLDLYEIRYTGSPAFGSALAMNKSVAKGIMQAAGITVPKGFMLSRGEAPLIPEFPCVVKPCSSGSSIGVSIIFDEADYLSALKKAFEADESVVVEQYIKGREFSVGVLGGKALPVIEIIPSEGFYDYSNKYQAGATKEVCPADIPAALAERMQKTAEKAHEALCLEVYSRADVILSEADEIYCLEANTLPGLTNVSLLPQEAKAAGISYDELIDRLVKISMKKYEVSGI